MNLLWIVLIGIVFVISFTYLLIYHRGRKIEDHTFGIKFRGNSIQKVQKGGKISLLPLIDKLYTLSGSPQTINLDKEIVNSEDGNTISIRGELEYKIVEPDKFLEETNPRGSTDLTHEVSSSLRSRVFQIVKTDLWGRGKIDLLKNERKTLKELRSNILYNLDLQDDELISFELEFDLNL